MPEYAMWTLIVALVMLSFGLFFESIRQGNLRKNINRELVDVKKRYEEEIKELHVKIENYENKIATLGKESKKFIHDPVDLSKPKNHIHEYDPYENT
jgi:uncharacterized protein YlxW (UPF0749 family)